MTTFSFQYGLPFMSVWDIRFCFKSISQLPNLSRAPFPSSDVSSDNILFQVHFIIVTIYKQSHIMLQEHLIIIIHSMHRSLITGIIPCMCPANERRRYIVTSLIGWAHTQNDPCWSELSTFGRHTFKCIFFKEIFLFYIKFHEIYTQELHW